MADFVSTLNVYHSQHGPVYRFRDANAAGQPQWCELVYGKLHVTASAATKAQAKQNCAGQMLWLLEHEPPQ